MEAWARRTAPRAALGSFGAPARLRSASQPPERLPCESPEPLRGGLPSESPEPLRAGDLLVVGLAGVYFSLHLFLLVVRVAWGLSLHRACAGS